MSRLLFLRLRSLPPDFSCLPLRLCLLDGNIHKENNLVLRAVMEQSRVEQRWQGEIANCALLRDNIVMLDYPSACWHRPASPWTHNPAEKQPSANGVFYGGLFSAYTVQSDITLTWAFDRAHLSGIFSSVLWCEPSAASLGWLASVVLLCFVL